MLFFLNLVFREGRPVLAEAERARILAAVGSVDLVVPFGEDTPEALIEAVRPDVLVKGADYAEAEVVGAELVRSWGGRVARVPLLEGRSTSLLIERLRKGASPGGAGAGPRDPGA